MCKELKRMFRPEHRDIEIIYLDDFAVEKRLYVGLVSPAGPVDVEATIHAHFAEEDAICETVRKAAEMKQ